MSGSTTASPIAPHGAERNSISIPFVLLASVLAGGGTLLLLIWLITFNWLYFVGVVPTIVGALLWFDPRAGSNRTG